MISYAGSNTVPLSSSNGKNLSGKKVRQIDLKCGIENGPAFAYYFNTPTRNSVSFLGSTLNFASRLEALAGEDEIIVSKELKNMIEEKYKFRKILVKDRMPDKIKSYEEVDVVYVLEGKRVRSKAYRP